MTRRRMTFEAIGTRWEITVEQTIKEDDWYLLLEAISKRIATFDKAYSRFRSDSLVAQMASKAGRYALPTDGYRMLQFYEKLYEATGGKVTPLIGQTVADAGYDAHYSLQTKKLQRPPRWDDVLRYGHHEIVVKKPLLLDFGAAGKGYLVDIVAEIMERAGLYHYTINAGGDILNRAKDESLAVGLENPQDATEAIGIAKILNQSICASAGNKRKWDKFHHIIDPETLESPQDIIATWVVANDTMTADGLVTALFFTEPERLQKDFDFTFAVLYKDMAIQKGKDFPATFFEA